MTNPALAARCRARMSEWSDASYQARLNFVRSIDPGEREREAARYGRLLNAIDRASRILDVAEGYALPGDEADRVRRAAELAEAYS